MKKNIINLLLILLFIFTLSACKPKISTPQTENGPLTAASGGITEVMVSGEQPSEGIFFIDDMGNEIHLDEPCETMIVLYSAHTENLYSLGVGDHIIGVNSTSIYPPDAAMKPVYDYNSDPEKVIAAEPACVVIRPFINRKSPDFVAAIGKAGIPVISLYPEGFDYFDEYFQKLGLLSGTEEKAVSLLNEFHANLAAISNLTEGIEPKKQVYFEATETNYRTVTSDSMPAIAIELAGGINIAKDVEPITEGSTIASFGIERILMNAENIDVYISQRGAMNAGGNEHSISIREGFENIKAVQTGDILEINEKLVSSPTLRFYKGVNEIARALYPEILDEINSFRSDEKISRADYAAILVRTSHRQIYLPSSSKYYQQEHSGHVYGLFQDVSWEDPAFDFIETAVLAGFMDGKENENGEYFDPSGFVTKEELAKSIYILFDFERQEEHFGILDLDQSENGRIVQILVDNQVFILDDGYFYPQDVLSYNDVINLFDSLTQR